MVFAASGFFSKNQGNILSTNKLKQFTAWLEFMNRLTVPIYRGQRPTKEK